MTEPINQPPPDPKRFDALTPRQRVVAELLARGYERLEIALKMGVSDKTVDTFRMQAMRRLGTRNNVELARLAIVEGVVEAPTPATWNADPDDIAVRVGAPS